MAPPRSNPTGTKSRRENLPQGVTPKPSQNSSYNLRLPTSSDGAGESAPGGEGGRSEGPLAGKMVRRQENPLYPASLSRGPARGRRGGKGRKVRGAGPAAATTTPEGKKRRGRRGGEALTGVLVPRPQVVGGGDDDEGYEAGEEVEESVAAVIVLELLPGHGCPHAPPPRSACVLAPSSSPSGSLLQGSRENEDGGRKEEEEREEQAPFAGPPAPPAALGASSRFASRPRPLPARLRQSQHSSQGRRRVTAQAPSQPL